MKASPKRGDKVIQNHFKSAKLSRDGVIEAAYWPETIAIGTVIKVHKTKGKRNQIEVVPDAPGFGVFFFELRHLEKIPCVITDEVKNDQPSK